MDLSAARHWPRRHLFPCAPIVALLVAWATPAAAQVNARPVSQFPPAPRDTRLALSRAEEAIAEQRFAEAAGILGDFFQDTDTEDYFVNSSGGASLKSAAQKLLFSLSRAGRESYELQYGAEARKMLDSAVADSDPARLADVMRIYVHTKAGYEASFLWARYQLDSGHPFSAAIVLDRLIANSPYLDEYEPQASLLAAVSWRLAGNETRAQEVLADLQRKMPNATVETGKGPVRIFSNPSQAIPWLDELIGHAPDSARAPVAQWTMHRGDAARNARSRGSLPLASLRWHKYLGRDEGDDKLLAERAKQLESEGIAAIPSLSPLVVHDTVLMRTPERVMGVDLATGKFIWRFPWPVTESAMSATGPSFAEQRRRELSQRVWEDRTYGQMASDGESVFFLDEMGYTGLGYVPQAIIGPGGRMMRNPGLPTTTNTLWALSARHGRQLWTVGGENGMDEPRLAGVFFLGAPLVADGKLYLLGELLGEIKLMVLDAATGKLEWTQQLAHIEMPYLQIGSDSNRRLAGVTPSMADGILICPTGAHTVVAVDIAQRKLLWGRRYDPASQAGTTNFVGFNAPTRPIGSYWIDSAPIIADGKVLLTPHDSDELICLDLLTGMPCWKTPVSRARNGLVESGLFVACVHQGKAIVVRASRVQAISLDDGSAAWAQPIDLAGTPPSGRGFYTGEHYYLPTAGRELLKIDLASGQIAARVSTERVLGNLVCYGDQVLSQNYDGVATYFQSEALRQRVAERLKQNPDDPLALAQQGQLLLHDGNDQEALTVLRKAHDLDPQNDETRSLLVRTLLASLRKDFNSYKSLAAEIEPLLDQPQQRRAFLRLKGEGLQKSGDRAGAFAAYARLAGLDIVERPDSAAYHALERIDQQLRVRADRWVQARMNEVYAAASEAERANLAQIIEQELSQLPATPSPDQLQRVIDYFGWHPLADAARIELAAARLEAGELVQAEALLTRFVQHEDDESPLAGRAAALLAAIYEKAGRHSYAAAQYLRLKNHWGAVAVRGDQTGQALYAEAEKRTPLGLYLTASDDWPRGAVTMGEGGDVVAFPAANIYARIYVMPVMEAVGALADGTSLAYDPQRRITLRDPLGNDWNQVVLPRYQPRTSTAPPATTHGRLLGHLAIVSVGDDLAAIDMLSRSRDSADPILWRHDVLPRASDNTGTITRVQTQTYSYPWGQPRVVATYSPDHVLGAVAALSERQLCYVRSRDVVCVDPLTGETLWERSQMSQGADLFSDGELLFVIPPRSSEAIVLSVADGRELGKRKVDTLEARWATCGRNVLTCRVDGRELVMKLFDAWAEKPLYEARFAAGTRATLIGRDEAAVMQPDGKLVIFSLADGRVIVDQQLEREPRLMNIHVVRSSQQYFVQMDTVIDARDALPNYTVQPSPGGDNSKLVTGRLYAFDRATGKPSWAVPAYISQYGLPLDQAPEAPLLVYLRQKTPVNANVPRNPMLGVLVIDRRTGELVFQRDDLRIAQANIYQWSASRLENNVTLTLRAGLNSVGKVFTFELSDKPTPPAPPAQTGAMASVIERKPGRSLLEAVGRALRRGAATGGLIDPDVDPFEPDEADPSIDEPDPFK